MEQIINEIDIMRAIQISQMDFISAVGSHSNEEQSFSVKLIDHLEDCTYIYIVTECLD